MKFILEKFLLNNIIQRGIIKQEEKKKKEKEQEEEKRNLSAILLTFILFDKNITWHIWKG